MSKAILIVDDNPYVRLRVRSVIEQAGFTVCGEAENGRRAIEQALQLKPDLILLDLAMPEMNGAKAASVLKHRLPDIPIILFTSHADGLGDDIRQALNVERIVSKFDGFAVLMQSINALLGVSNYETKLSTGD
jgi:DNA-binding NarL/FixJ family response regulator